MLQTLLGSAYQVRNFGDCCGTVLQGYAPQETHPYVLGALSAAEGPGYNESIAFQPDIVVIGSWGRHDWGMAKASTETWNLAKFETDYDDLVQRYQKLPTHPTIFVSLPIPIPYGQATPATGVATSTVLPAIKSIADKYHLPIVDLYTPFLGHRELFKQPPDAEGEGEHVTDGPGLHAIADAVYAAIMAYSRDGGAIVDSGNDADAGAIVDASQERSTVETDSTAGAGGSPPDVTGGAGGASGPSGGGGGASAAGGAGFAGSVGQAGARTNAGGSSAGMARGVSDNLGCGCSSVGRRTPATRSLALPFAGLVLLTRRRRSRRRALRADVS
jgi:hypothetical protein